MKQLRFQFMERRKFGILDLLKWMLYCQIWFAAVLWFVMLVKWLMPYCAGYGNVIFFGSAGVVVAFCMVMIVFETIQDRKRAKIDKQYNLPEWMMNV